MARIQLHKVTKEYKEDKKIVKGISLDIADGEFVVLVGPSGCGKTTTLRMIAGLEEVSGGEIRIGERVVNDVPPKDRDIAMVFQSYALYPHMSVYDNIAFGLRMRKIDKAEIERRTKDAANTVKLTEYLTRKPKDLSGGQRQRVALARAIVREPAAFLMDEPLSNLDTQLRAYTCGEILQMQRRMKATMVYVTHNQDEARRGDRIVVMKDGKIQQVGRPLDVYHRPANAFVAGFIGSPQMNRIKCELVGSDERLAARGKSFSLNLPPSFRRGLERSRGTELLVGVRPEDFTFVLQGNGNGAGEEVPGKAADGRLKAKVVSIDATGAEQFIVFSSEEKTVPEDPEDPEDSDKLRVCVAPDVRVRVGDVVCLQPNLDRLHVFDRADGVAYC
jgi:multiple sugar transport system ATP-binding protein